jgi:hypothetical protein
MITFITPTLWKSDKILDNIESFKKANIPNSEFIVIDNTNSSFNDPQVKVLKQDENIFVNPAWNLGFEYASNEILCILNDDISFNFKNLYHNLSKIDDLDFGVIGFDANANFYEEHNNDNDDYIFEEAPCRSLGFGCMMIIKKSNYIVIDKELKVFFGDDLLYWWNKDYHKRKIYNITNFKAVGELSVTSKDYEHVMQLESDTFQDVVKKLINHAN